MNPFFQFFKRRVTPQRYLFADAIPKVKVYEGAVVYELPAPKPIDMPLAEVVVKRISQYPVSSEPISKCELSQLLYYSAAVLGSRPDGQGLQEEPKQYRPHPSGGHKYPLETYLFILEGQAYPAGLYHYRPDLHALEQVRHLEMSDVPVLLESFAPYRSIAEAGVVVLFSFVLERSAPKYGNFAYKLGLLEAGHLAQNFYLACAALGLRCNAIGGFNEAPWHERAGLDGWNETFIYALLIGK